VRWILAIPIVVHGLIHLLGFAKAFGLAEMPELRIPIARPVGLLWLAAAVSMLVTAAAFVAAPGVWWMLAFGAVVVSQVVIVTSWSDARFGTLANLFVLLLAVHGLASQGPWSLAAEYRAAVRERLEPGATVPADVTEDDLESVPPPVQRYLRATGAVGEPRVESVRVRWSGRIRSAPDEAWMPFQAEQYLFTDEPARLFLMDARRTGLPVDVLHVYDRGRARMDVRLLSMVPLVQQRGEDLGRAETVTVFNDLCLLAPTALLDPGIEWRTIDAHTVHARFTAGGHTVGATLVFGSDGELVDFVSDDRARSTDTGLEPTPWSTPVGDYVRVGPRRVIGRGEGRWHPDEGEFVYLELDLLAYEPNVHAQPGSR